MADVAVTDAPVEPPVTYHCDINDVSVTTHRLYLFVMGPILVAGLVLNFLNIAVFRRTKSPSNSFYMLQFMALSDILYLFVCLLYFPIRRIVEQIKHGDQVYKRGDWNIGTDMLIVIDPLYHMLLVTRNWMVVVITVERLANILFPLWARTAITRFRLKIVVLLVFLMGMLLHIPKWFTWYLDHGVNECTGEPAMYIRVPRKMIESEHYIYIVMTVTAPMISIYVANILLIISLRRVFVERAKITGTDQAESNLQQRQAIIIVLAMSMVFTVFETPACLDRFFYIAGVESPLTGLLRRGSLILNITDSTVNFFAYCASSRPFRASLMALVGKGEQQKGSTTTATKSSDISQSA